MPDVKSKLTVESWDKDLGKLRSRAVMSAMTRGFADKRHCAVDAMAEYYGARAMNGTGLIVTEGIIVSQRGDGYNNVPHMLREEHAYSWRKVVDRVHRYGSLVFAQLWHCGRVSHEHYTGGLPPLSSTDEALAGVNRQNGLRYAKPVIATTKDIESVIHSFGQSARLCKISGFDGVELHYGHGYLVDQFLNGSVNRHKDGYGGSIDKRCKLALEIFREVSRFYSPQRIMVRISPLWMPGGMLSVWPDWERQVIFLIEELQKSGCRMLDVSAGNANFEECALKVIRHVRNSWKGLIIGGASLDRETAERYLVSGKVDLVTWGRLFIANADLVRKFRKSEPIKPFQSEMLASLS